ncbi:MAG: DUF3393 domain-containing protein, partial [Gammaproteobacteria bacterium]|nr:DUF3393 domain-containing protein [Gammaproteobacteria bacterium]
MSRPALFTLIIAILLEACTSRQTTEVALSNNPAKSVETPARQKAVEYSKNPVIPAEEITAARQRYQRFLKLFRAKLKKRWGGRETLTSSRRHYVKYTQNYQSRTVVDFDQGTVVIETLDHRSPLTSLRNATVVTLLTPDDPRSVDLYSPRKVELGGRPYLYGLVLDQGNHPVDNQRQADIYSRYLVANQRKTRSVITPAGKRALYYVTIPMVRNHVEIRARHYAPYVDRYARRFGVSKSLIYAVMKVESNFNPFAVSSAPAYGLMQLVPTTGGRDAYRHARGRDVTPSRDYLFHPGNNIELGIAYLHLVDSQFLAGVKDPVSREYCTIAAYNG